MANDVRPTRLSEYNGQDAVRAHMQIYLDSARARDKQLDHAVFYGQPGLGKTTLAGIIANELDAPFRVISAPTIKNPKDLTTILMTIQEREILFFDEIHRLTIKTEELLYSAMEDFCADVVMGTGKYADTYRIEIPRFTLIGATTRMGLLSAPLRDRFGIIETLVPYSPEALTKIVQRSAGILGYAIDDDAAQAIGQRGRGTPRIANRILSRVIDVSVSRGDPKITLEAAEIGMQMLGVDEYGLNEIDRKLLYALRDNFDGKPVGLETLAAAIGEDAGTLEDVSEPFLIRSGMIERTPRGRQLTKIGQRHIEGRTAANG